MSKPYEKMTNVERVMYHWRHPDGVVEQRDALLDIMIKMNMKDDDQHNRCMTQITDLDYDAKLRKLTWRERVRPDELQAAIDQVKRSSTRIRRIIRDNKAYDTMFRRLYDDRD